jgi:hypothetical protein
MAENPVSPELRVLSRSVQTLIQSRPLISAVLVAASLLAACQSSTPSPFSASSIQPLRIEQIATSASADGGEGLRREGDAPAPNGGPRITLSGNQTVVNGGTLAVGVQGATPFSSVYVQIAGKTLGLAAESNGGVSGHYELRLPASQSAATILLTFPQAIPLPEFDVRFAAASAAGAVGPYAGLATRVTEVGTGDVQVTLSWDADSDVDLHVIGPDGEEIYYGDRQSASGGELDLDSNAACVIDGVRNENITWPVGRALAGLYTVRVDYWDSCTVERTNFTVRINNAGATQIAGGSFTGPGDQGGPGSGQTVATFERLTGPSPEVFFRALTGALTPPTTFAPKKGARPGTANHD